MTPNEEKKLSLTQKEERISEGKTSKEIADVLCLSLNTIKWYRKKLKAKFDSSSTIQTVRKAIDLGIIN